MSSEQESMARMQHQREEFDAAAELSKRLRQLPPVVDDDYPEARHNYESALAAFLEAMAKNGRFGRGNRYRLQAVAIGPPRGIVAPVLSAEERDALRQSFEDAYTVRPGPAEAAILRLVTAARGFVDSFKASLCMELHMLRQVRVGEVDYVYCPKCDRAWSPDVDGWQQVDAGSNLLKDIERGSHEARGNVTE